MINYLNEMRTSIRCSQLSRIFNCTHSLLLPEEKRETSFSKEGTDQHEWCAEAIANNFDDSDDRLNYNSIFYINYLKRICSNLDRSNYLSEQFVAINFENFILSGTPDFFVLRDNELEVVDLKNGYFEIHPTCLQLKGYALLILKGWGLKVDKVILTIVQNNEASSISVSYEDIVEDFNNTLIDIMSLYTYRLGEHCGFCPSKIHCKKIRNKTNQGLFAWSHLMKGDNEEMIDIVRNEKTIKNAIDESKEFLLKTNPDLFYFKTRRFKRWKNEDEAPMDDKKMSPPKAIRLKIADMDNIETIEHKYYHINQDV